MGKNKNKNRGNNQEQKQQGNSEEQKQGNSEEQKQKENSEEQNHEETNNNNKDRTADENSNESKGKNNNNKQQGSGAGAGAIVLGVYLHCQGCVETVVKSLRGFDGVEEIEPNTKDHRVVVKGKTADPVKVAERLRKKSGKHVELISPVPKKQQEKKSEKKAEAPKVVETVLKMRLHCEGCAKDVKHCLHKMQGVQTVNIDMNASQVTVKGSFDPKELVAYVSKRAGRNAEIVTGKNQKKNKGEGGEENEKEKEKKEKEKDKEGKNIGLSYPQVPPGLVYAPQLFSDENPNACSIM